MSGIDAVIVSFAVSIVAHFAVAAVKIPDRHPFVVGLRLGDDDGRRHRSRRDARPWPRLRRDGVGKFVESIGHCWNPVRL